MSQKDKFNETGEGLAVRQETVQTIQSLVTSNNLNQKTYKFGSEASSKNGARFQKKFNSLSYNNQLYQKTDGKLNFGGTYEISESIHISQGNGSALNSNHKMQTLNSNQLNQKAKEIQQANAPVESIHS